ncbi:MAG: flagellar export chaperone FliS [Acidobacteriota bacterium]|nr:flagellar export chaperone FliS [Acidobacteriota bacterium]
MSFSDPYQAYVEGSVFSGNPLSMVIALYEGTIKSIGKARQCLATGDVWGRSKAVNDGIKLLTELLVSLDHKEGGEISANLKRIYSYLQCRLLDAHAQRAEEPFIEAERLLSTMLEGWRAAAEKMSAEGYGSKREFQRPYEPETDWKEQPAFGYGFFSEETPELAGCLSAVF